MTPSAPTIGPPKQLPRAVVILEGAGESLDVPGTRGEYFGPVEDPALIEGAECVRMRWRLYGTDTTIVEGIELLYDF